MNEALKFLYSNGYKDASLGQARPNITAYKYKYKICNRDFAVSEVRVKVKVH